MLCYVVMKRRTYFFGDYSTYMPHGHSIHRVLSEKFYFRKHMASLEEEEEEDDAEREDAQVGASASLSASKETDAKQRRPISHCRCSEVQVS